MRNEELIFNEVDDDSAKFLSRLYKARLMNREGGRPKVSEDLSSLTLSFKGFKAEDRLQLIDVATLALVVRAVAEAAKPVTIIYPGRFHGSPSRLHVFLEKLGFHELFSPEEPTPWQQRVQFSGYEAIAVESEKRLDRARYVPLQWFTDSDFEYDKSVDIWKSEHNISRKFDDRFRSMLHLQRYGDSSTIDLVCRTMFMELGWNTVIHSAETAGVGVGIFGAQIIGGTNLDSRALTFTFCVADLGNGIPETLRSAYEADDDKGKKQFPEYTRLIANDILRYSLFPNTTSRPAFPSTWSKESLRGLARVTQALEGRGTLAIRSEGAAISLEGAFDETNDKTDDVYEHCPFFGTQVLGTLTQDPDLTAFLTKPSAVTLPQGIVSLVCNIYGRCGVTRTENAARSFANSVEISRDILILDFGYGEDSSRNLEYLCRSLADSCRNKWLIFWNVRSQWAELASLDEWMGKSDFAIRPLFVRAHDDMRMLGVQNVNPSSPSVHVRSAYAAAARLLIDGRKNHGGASASVGQPVLLSLKEYLGICREVNGTYLGAAFTAVGSGSRPNGTAGFFVGQIHLLGGQPAETRYFSLGPNLQAGGRNHVLRWSASAAAGIALLLETKSVPDAKLVLLAFTGTVREIALEIYSRLNRRCRAHVLLTFDVPSKHEIKSLIEKEDQVVLLTDVISSGSLVESVIDLVTRLDGHILGIVSLVQRRVSETVKEDTFIVGTTAYPLISCGCLPVAEIQTGRGADDKLYVDPVSLVPSLQKPWGWAKEHDEKVERTLQLIHDTESANCGHLVDGVRHTSVYIDLRRLLQVGTNVARRQAQAVFAERMKRRKWTDFTPKVILFPSGIARIESISAPIDSSSTNNSLTTYHTAVSAYVDLLVQLWEKRDELIARVEVQRSFDPGGNSRCSKTVQWPHALSKEFDVVIADDGLWRGTTANALVQLAVERGAKRILVAPLLARLTPPDAEQLEVQHSIESPHGSSVQVCFAFPLLLPVPYYGAHECPYEATIMHLGAKHFRLPTISQTAKVLIENLQGRHPSAKLDHSVQFNDTWVRARAYVELASLNEGALQKLGTLVTTVQHPEELMALFTLFLEEWHLLGRARLRQSIRDQVRKRAREVVRDPKYSVMLRLSAMTFLRSLFRRDFVAELPSVVDLALADIRALGRLLFQVASLGDQWREAPECLRFLDEVTERGTALPSKNVMDETLADRKRFVDLIADGRSLAVDWRSQQAASSLSNRQVASQLWENLLNSGFAENHHMRAFFKLFATNPPPFEQLDTTMIATYWGPWKSTFQPRLSGLIYPQVRKLSKLLLRTGNPDHSIMRSDLRFLRDDAAELLDRISGVSTWLNFLRETAESGRLQELRSDTSRYYWENFLANACRIHADLIGQKSTIVRLLEEIRSVTAADFTALFAREIGAQFTIVKRPIEVLQVDGLEKIQPSATVFGSKAVLDDCIANVIHNLLRYAFPEESTAENPQVKISVREIPEGHDSLLEICIRNNGEKLESGAEPGDGGRRVNADLGRFGGRYYPPFATEEAGWRVLQRLHVPLW